MQTLALREQTMTEGSNLVDNKMIWKKKWKKVISIFDEEPLFLIILLLRSTSRDETPLLNVKVSSPGAELDRIAMPPPQSPMGTM